jgi:hypothetical protein
MVILCFSCHFDKYWSWSFELVVLSVSLSAWGVICLVHLSWDIIMLLVQINCVVLLIFQNSLSKAFGLMTFFDQVLTLYEMLWNLKFCCRVFWDGETSRAGSNLVSLIARRSFLHFSSTYYKTVLSVALKFLCLGLQNALWVEFAPCNNVHIFFTASYILFHDSEFPYYIAFVGFLCFFNYNYFKNSIITAMIVFAFLTVYLSLQHDYPWCFNSSQV